MKSLITLLSILFCLTVQAQLSVKDGLELRKMLLANVNELRDSLGLNSLKEEKHLQEAAADHSKYMAKNNVLSHDEKGPGRTPAKRVRRAGSRDFDIVGENVLFTGVDNFKFNKKELEGLARDMYLQWRSSPPHYRNMSQQQYVFGDIGISADTKGKKIYATQVFGAKGVQVEGQISRNGFGVRNTNTTCKGLFENEAVNIGNSAWISNDTVYLSYHDISVVKRFFSGPKDGIAVDLLTRDQVSCDGPNILDMSSVYDGIMLKPTYGSEMIRGNIAEGENRIITKIGIVPKELLEEDLSIGIIYIKNNQSCRYTYPAYVPAEKYVLEPFDPIMKTGGVQLSNEGIVRSERIPFDFERSALVSKNTPVINGASEKVHSLRVLSYSSVEGSTKGNIQLHEDRAKFIINYIRKRVNITGGKLEVDAQENWQLMDFQLRYLFADSLSELPRQELKKLIASGDQSLDWERLLFEQRSSTAFINYAGKIDRSKSTAEAYLSMNLTTALAESDMKRANQALYELMNPEDQLNTAIVFDPQIFDALLKEKELVQNAAAVMSSNFFINRMNATLFVHAWALRLDELDQQAKENVLHLYSLLGYQLVQEWDVSAKKLSNVIHPKRLEKLINTTLPAEILLNANLTFLYYYGHTLEREGIERTFAYVSDYMEEKTLSEEQLYKLTLFFNDWSQYERTIKTLMKSFESHKVSDDNLKILAHTAVGYDFEAKNNDRFFEIMEELKNADETYWCNWLTQEFQIRRSLEIKQLFCETCPN